jgi:uncharacterized membrane protein
MTLPRELIVLLISMLPVLERFGIPAGTYLGLPIEATVFWAILGNMIPVVFLLKLLGPVTSWLMRHSKWCHKIFTKIFEKTHLKHTHHFNRIGAAIIIIITAIPLPGTGAWTGALLAFLFNVPFWKALLYTFIGIVISTTIIALGVETATNAPAILNIFLK